MTKPDLDRHFTEAYQSLLELARQRADRQSAKDIVHTVYCQILVSESYLSISKGKKAAHHWLHCRVALEAKAERRKAWQWEGLEDGDEDDEEKD